MPRVIASQMRRPIASSLMVAAMAFAAALPPAHIHLAIGHDDHDHDHATAVEHSHWSAHQSSRASFDDDDGRVIFVDRPARSSSVETTFARPSVVLIALIGLLSPSTFTAADRPTSGNSPRDGPARGATPLRAPPSFDTL
jgi:hypothetical protein